MALADYRLCDVCEGKAFYDSQLNYKQSKDWGGQPITSSLRNGGEMMPATSLDSVGDWVVICTDCAKTHKCVIVPPSTRRGESNELAPDHQYGRRHGTGCAAT